VATKKADEETVAKKAEGEEAAAEKAEEEAAAKQGEEEEKATAKKAEYNWMWGDVRRGARRNPMRWSGWKDCHSCTESLRVNMDTSRPVVIMIGRSSSEEKSFASITQAIEYLSGWPASLQQG